jgi:GNAT superfamily N-acetyltransferase
MTDAQKDGWRKKLTPQKAVKWVRAWALKDSADLVMEKELVDEGYKPKTSLRVVEGDRQAFRRFCHENAEVRWDDEAKFLSYLDNGYRAVLAEVDGKAVGYVWWHDHQLDRASLHPQVSRLGIELKPGEAYSFDLFLLPQHRGGGVSNDLFGLFRRHLRDAGYTKVYGIATSTNLPALWIHKVHGYRTVKKIEVRLLCGHSLMWSGGHLYLRNPPFGVKQKFDFRRIW